jgi:beta-galactosidase
MRFGADYYPEHWPVERWARDAALMREAGIEVVRMAEFAWARMEPEPGRYDFGWLDHAVQTLAGAGISTILGTPTAAPPAWLVGRHPEILPLNREGLRLGFGGRHHVCHSNTVYREQVRSIVTAMARHFRDNPRVIGWQIDNELGNSHRDLCYCGSCCDRFREWLKDRYGEIHRLNEAWGTVFWSQSYGSFGEIPGPLPTPNSHNPSLLLDWRRFASALIVEFQNLQVEVLRSECPDRFITHNFMGFFDKTNYFDLAESLDFVSQDQYPRLFVQGKIAPSPPDLAMSLDLVRGLKQRTFWVMEQQAGPAGWELVGSTPEPGQLRLWSYQSVAHGADAVLYFRWRTCLFGTEQYWHGILPHSGVPGRRYAEIRDTIRELAPVMDRLEGCLCGAEVALLYSYDQRWALQIQPHHPELDYLGQLKRYYRELARANVPVDLISERGDFSHYRILVAPLLFLMTAELARKLRAYVEQGGHLVLTMRTAVKDWSNVVVPELLPAYLRDVLGIEVHDYDCLRGGPVGIRWLAEPDRAPETGDSMQGEKWADVITLRGARSLAVYAGGYYAGTPAVTANRFGGGTAYYVASEPGPELAERFVAYLLGQAGVRAIMATPSGVEAVRRSCAGKSVVFLLNHAPRAALLRIPSEWSHVEGEKASKGELTLPAYGVAVFET